VKRERGHIQRLPNFGVPQLSQERVKLRTSNFVRIFIASMEEKPIKNFGKSSRKHSQGFPKIFRALIYRAHRAVIFAIAQLSCSVPCFVVVRLSRLTVSFLCALCVSVVCSMMFYLLFSPCANRSLQPFRNSA